MRDGKGGGRGRVLASGPSFCCMFCWRTAIHMNFGRWRGTLMPREKRYKKRSIRRGIRRGYTSQKKDQLLQSLRTAFKCHKTERAAARHPLDLSKRVLCPLEERPTT